MNWKRTARWSWLILPFLLLGIWPSVAAAADTTLYELTENMKLKGGKIKHRQATSAIMGFANVNTPPCPKELVDKVSPGATFCTINAIGSDNVNEKTGLGSLRGRYTVVVQGDNPFDGPELVVSKGEFKGKIDFSPVFTTGAPYGTVSGTLTPDDGHEKFHYTGVFRQPFLGSVVEPHSGKTLRQLFCPGSSPNPNFGPGGPDLAYIDTVAVAPGVVVPNGNCINILPNELSLGTPTVRLDISY